LFPNVNTVYEDDGTKTVPATFLAFGDIGESVTDTQIQISNPGQIVSGFVPGAFNGPSFDFLGSGNLIVSVTVDPASQAPGFDASRLSLSPDGSGGQLVQINFEGLPIYPDFNAIVDVNTAPEPASLSLMVFGVIGAAGYAWRRRHASRDKVKRSS
jgi:hypothetical protein